MIAAPAATVATYSALVSYVMDLVVVLGHGEYACDARTQVIGTHPGTADASDFESGVPTRPRPTSNVPATWTSCIPEHD